MICYTTANQSWCWSYPDQAFVLHSGLVVGLAGPNTCAGSSPGPCIGVSSLAHEACKAGIGGDLNGHGCIRPFRKPS